MYVVIFKATVAIADSEYVQTAARMRELAMEKYGCTGFDSVTENGLEFSVSHWPDLVRMQAWRSDAEHRLAQELGKNRWYESYSVHIAEVIRSYASAS